MASQGLRETAAGTEKIANPEELERVRRNGRMVVRLSMISAVVATGLALVSDLAAAVS